MKHISRLLILCLLLTGCAAEEPVIPVAEPPAETVAARGLYQPGSDLEISSSGAVRLFCLEERKGKDLLRLGEDLILFSGESNTSLTLLTGEGLIPVAVKTLPFVLTAEDCTVNQQAKTVSFYDPTAGQMVVLGKKLQETARWKMPDNLCGHPVCTRDGTRMYYGKEGAVWVWDQEKDIHRVLKQTSQQVIAVTELVFDETVLVCQVWEGERMRTVFLSAETGALLREETARIKLSTGKDRYTAAVWETNQWSLLWGDREGEQMSLTPGVLSSEFYLLEEQTAVAVASVSGHVVVLEQYDLDTGKRTGLQMFRGKQPLAVVSRQGGLDVLLELEGYENPALCRWEPGRSGFSDPNVYTGPRYTGWAPDTAGLEQCRERAEEIGQRYGLEILLWKEGAQNAPEGITLEPEHRVNILNRELELLDSRLSRFPEGMLAETAENFGAVRLCLVSRIGGSVTGEEGLQFFDGSDAYLVLSAGQTSEQALYHGLFHVMETHIFARSGALDRWEDWNPQGFRYDYDFQTNAIRNSGIYLTAENRAFVDTFSMSYPREDRARIMEFAMMPQKESLFCTSAMQNKLRCLCQGIREAYGLTDPRKYPWEQYLK